MFYRFREEVWRKRCLSNDEDVEGFFFVFRWCTFNNGANVSSVFFSFFFFIENVLRKLSSFNDENICACIMECM